MGTDQDESGYQRQFNAAVSVIQNLPKSGSYRPSYEEMLLFYSYYKQATVGPCNITRPGFWDPIGRYKWNAWNKLGHISQEDAMCAYITEMKKVAQKIIDTVPLEDKSPEMFEPFRPLYEVIPDMPRPPDSFFKSHTKEDIFEDDVYQSLEKGEEQYTPTQEQVEQGTLRGHEEVEKRRDPVGEAAQSEISDRRLGSWGSENEYFSDSLDKQVPDQKYENEGSMVNPHLFQASDVGHKKAKPKTKRHSSERQKNHDSFSVSQSISDGLRNPGESTKLDITSGSQNKCGNSSHQLSPQIAATVEALQASVHGLCQRLESLERALQDQQQYIRDRTHRSPKELVPQHSGIAQSQTILFIVIWPFIVHWFLRKLYSRKS